MTDLRYPGFVYWQSFWMTKHKMRKGIHRKETPMKPNKTDKKFVLVLYQLIKT